MSPRIDDPMPGDPEPLTQPTAVVAAAWNIVRRLKSVQYRPPPRAEFNDIFERRRSRRMIRPARLSDVANLVGYATASRFTARNLGIERWRRPSPSAGALHPIQIVMIAAGSRPRAFLCDPDNQSLGQLRIADPTRLKAFVRRCADILPKAQGTLLLFVGDSARVGSAYRNEESLLWRDAGALLQTLFLAATAFDLAFCPLGILGQDALVAIGAPPLLSAVGVAYVGL